MLGFFDAALSRLIGLCMLLPTPQAPVVGRELIEGAVRRFALGGCVEPFDGVHQCPVRRRA
jgi:hypothetical protein